MRTSPSAALARCTARQKGATLYREAPHNIEAEQALLGAILVNNQAYHQVSGSLESRHFFEPLHQHIFEVSAELIRNGRIANAITLKDYFAADQRIADLTPTQYLARLSAEATSIIGAVDYARTISDLHTRRCLIVIGEKMVDQSYDAPVDFSAQVEIDDVRSRLDQVAKAAGPPRVERFKELSLDEIRLEENEQPYLIEGLLPAGPSFCATVGWPKSFKSFVKQHADLHIASGKEYGGRKVRQGPVIYFTSEGIIGVKHRLIAMKLALELEPDVPFFLIPAMPNLGTAPGDYPEVKAKIDHIQQRLGVPIAKIDFDTVRRAMPGKDENTAKDMGVFVDNCGKLMDDFKCVVDVNHHSPRSNGTRGSGNNTLDAALDAMWSCFRPDKGRKATVSIEFMKDSPDDGISWEIELRDYPLTGPDNRNYTPCVVDIVAKPGEALAAAQVAERAKTAAKVPLNVKAFLESFNETLHRYAKQMRAMGDGPLVQAVPLQRVRKSSTCAMSPIQRMTRGERAHFKSNSLAPENGSMSVRRPGKSNLRPLVGNTTWIWRTGHTGHTGLWSFMSPEVTLGDGIGH